MKKKMILALLTASLCSFSACGKDDIGSLDDSVIINEGSLSENTEENNSAEISESASERGYVVTEVPTTTITDGENITPESIPEETVPTPETPSPVTETPAPPSPVTETPAPSAPSVIDYSPSTAAPGTPASTAVLPLDAPTESDYNYGAPPTVYNIPGIKYIDNVLIANKSYSLPADFYPELDQTCLNQFYKLQNDAAAVGLNIYLSSGFRSYETQDYIYNDYVARDGQEKADTYSARPGHSEHQSGLAIDVNQIDDTFIGTPEAIWLEAHCYEYGFILRYPQSKQDITGYKYESWHIRYVGTDMSYKIHNKAVEMGDPYLTLEEYFGIDSYYH